MTNQVLSRYMVYYLLVKKILLEKGNLSLPIKYENKIFQISLLLWKLIYESKCKNQYVPFK